MKKREAKSYVEELRRFHERYSTPSVHKEPYIEHAKLYSKLADPLYYQILDAWRRGNYDAIPELAEQYSVIANKAYYDKEPFFNCHKRELEMEAEEKAKKEAEIAKSKLAWEEHCRRLNSSNPNVVFDELVNDGLFDSIFAPRKPRPYDAYLSSSNFGR